MTLTWEEFALKIWRRRPHRCQCCGLPLSYPIRTFYFSHVLSRGAYIVAKYWLENVLLMCWDCHQEWEYGYEQIRNQKKFDVAHKMARIVRYEIETLKAD